MNYKKTKNDDKQNSYIYIGNKRWKFNHWGCVLIYVGKHIGITKDAFQKLSKEIRDQKLTLETKEKSAT